MQQLPPKITHQDKLFMREACWQCDLSNCVHKTGCVAVCGKRVIAKSHNVLLDTQYSQQDPERDYALHSEANLVAEAARTGLSLKKAVIYTSRFPCVNCARLLYVAGATKIFYMANLFTANNSAQEFFDQVNIPVIQLPEDLVWKGYHV